MGPTEDKPPSVAIVRSVLDLAVICSRRIAKTLLGWSTRANQRPDAMDKPDRGRIILV
jgi:hypothetical protein